jgi:Flp pilus assembly protein TadB
MPYYLNPPPSNPLSKLIAAVIAVLALMGSFILGFAVLLVVAGIGLLLAIAIWVRVFMIKRRLKKQGVHFEDMSRPVQRTGDVIEAEYTVISERQEDEKP